MYLTMSFPKDYIYIYIISDFKELNYTNNTNYVVYSHIKGPVNSKSSQMHCNKHSGLKYEESVQNEEKCHIWVAVTFQFQ